MIKKNKKQKNIGNKRLDELGSNLATWEKTKIVDSQYFVEPSWFSSLYHPSCSVGNHMLVSLLVGRIYF